MKKLVLFMVMIFFVMTAANVFAGGENIESIFYNDDKLSLEEFVGLAGKPELVFVNIDTDKDGRITKKELCVLYDDVAFCEKRFTHYDRNGDGYIILKEFEVVFK